MKIGCVYPQIELGGDPGAVKAFAQAAEGLGYDHIVVYDHVLGAEHADRRPPLTGPYKESDPFHEPLVMFAYLAGITERIELMTGVIILPQRQTALVAKQAADVDLFSGERLRFGVGVGWNWVREISEHHEVWIITKANNRDSIAIKIKPLLTLSKFFKVLSAKLLPESWVKDFDDFIHAGLYNCSQN